MKKIWRFLLENFDTVVAILVSIFATLYGALGGDQVALLAAIATVLGLLAFGIIRDRQTRETLSENIIRLDQSMQVTLKGKVSSENFFLRRTQAPSLAEFLKSSTESLDLLGYSLISVGTIHSNTLRELKERGGKVRVIVANPENPALTELLSKRFKELDNSSVAKSHIVTTLSTLLPLVGKSKNGGSFSIRVTDFYPTFSFIGVDIKRPTGKCQIEFPLNRIGVGQNPVFVLEATNDVNWFTEFKDQFELLWSQGREIDVSNGK